MNDLFTAALPFKNYQKDSVYLIKRLDKRCLFV